MSSSIKSWSITALALCAMALTALASAQTQDYPTAKGSNLRQGNNGNPAGDNPGAAVLKWFAPNPLTNPNVGTSTYRTDTSTAAFALGNWLAPVLGGAATPTYDYSGADPLIGNNIGTPYVYTTVVPCATNGNPLAAAPGFALADFTWSVAPATGANDYALFFYLPPGPTIDALGNYTYQPEFYVFEIDYGTGQRYIDIVDSHIAGYGWIRLGNGGAATNVLFHYDGVTPMAIHLYNTVPRNSQGQLQGVAVDGAGNLAAQYDVYANAVRASFDYGSITSSPIIGTHTDSVTNLPVTSVFAATNLDVQTIQSGTALTQQKGVLTSYQYAAPGNINWTFTPNDQTVGATLAPPSAYVGVTGAWTARTTTPLTGFAGFAGSNYYYEPVTNNPASTDVVTFAPPIADGTYDVQLWLPGPTNPAVPGYPVFAQAVQVEVDQGLTKTFYNVDLSQSNGFISIAPGTRFTNTQAAPLVVKVTNIDVNLGDVGKLAFANAVRFVGSANLAITSTPVHAVVPIHYQYFDPVANTNVNVTQNKAVVVVCGEDGRIYCLDAQGRGDGTTDIYWTYPSLPDPTNAAWTDPNNNSPVGTVPTAPDGSNGVTTAQMPTGFSLSSPLIQEVPPGSGNFFLYVASNNGRVYCIDMKGRGDNFLTTRTPGTTTRIWTFPNDYRPDSPNIPAAPSALGATNASLVYNTNPASGPTIFVPSAQGRIYALDAAGNPAQTTTTTRWAYPAVTAPTVGPFNSTPAIDGAAGAQSLFAGTERKNANSVGQFFSLNVETGAVNWVFQGDANAAADDFEGGPATAFNGLADGIPGSQYVFVSNQNGYIYALDNTNAGAVIWETNEMATGTSAPLMFTNEIVFNIAGGTTPTPVPILMVADDAGQFYGLFANGSAASAYPRINVVGGKLAYGYKADGDQIYAGMASGHTYMYGADNHGYIYGFQGGTPGGGGGISGPGNGGDILPPNDPATQAFAGAKIAFLNQATYNKLRYPATPPDYTASTAPANFINRTAFDFGETLYIMVYNFPNPAALGSGALPLANFTISAEGRTMRQSQVAAQGFSGAYPTDTFGNKLNGYALLAFPLHPVGQNMMAPGSGSIAYSFQLTGVRNQYVMANPGGQQMLFTIANPLGIAMYEDGSPAGFGQIGDSIGADNAAFGDPTNWQNKINGNPSYAPGATFNPAAMVAGMPVTQAPAIDGLAAPSRTIYAYDRSLMELLNGPDNIVNGVAGSISIRVDRANAAWSGGYGAVVKPLGGANGLYGGSVLQLENWEDYPTDYPNVSLDYPDIQREFLSVTSFPATAAGNPLFSAVTLPNPVGVLDAVGKPVANPSGRQPTPMPIQIDTNVPLYQPANISTFQDSLNGNQLTYSGYQSPMDVFIDPNGSGKLTFNGGSRSAYRSFTYELGVDVREHMSVLTPNVDLGALPNGAGLTLPSAGVGLNSVLSPWLDLTQPSHIYQPFQAINDGNVNMLNVRLAKSYNFATGGYFGWPFLASANDDLGYLDGSLYLWSDLDAYQNNGAPVGFSPSLTANGGPLKNGEVIVQKARPSSSSGTRISSNPVTFPNGNLGNAGGTPMNPGYPSGLDPRIGIAPAIGFPSGSYSGFVRLIEDRNYQSIGSTFNYDMSILLGTPPAGGEIFADPSLSLSFTVREARLTNAPSPHTAAMADNNLPGGATNSYDSNIEPAGMRDRAFGNLFFAWSSNRTAINNGALANSDVAYRIYAGSLTGATPAGTGSPLNELAKFSSANANQWFATAGPYPFGGSLANSAAANAAFGTVAPDHVVGANAGEEDTVRFGQPALPAGGLQNPFSVGDATGATDFKHAIMAFTGTATVQTATGRFTVNRLFATTVQPNAGGAATIGVPVPSVNDPDLPMSKPSVAQVGPDQAVIFYGGGSGGRSRLYYELFNAATGTFSQTVPIDTGPGFDYATDPSAQARAYQGVDAADEAQSGNMIELSFSARLRGRANSEIFLARIPTDVNGAPNNSNSNNQLLSYFATRFTEQLELQGAGVYRAIGAGWNPVQGDPNRSIVIGVQTGTGVPVSIVTPGTAQVFDAQSGILTLQTSLGLVYVDTFEGTVRFANTTPGTNFHVYATYQPKFLRLSVSKTAGLSGPVMLWDGRHVGSTNFNQGSFQMFDRFWYVGNAHATLTDPRLLNSRYVVMYNRSAAGTGQSARPLMETIRLGAQVYVPTSTGLGTAIPTLSNGDVDFANFNVAGTANPYQVDPVNGRVYFTALDEDRVVTITVRGVSSTYKVGLLPEESETPVPIDQPINEGRVAAFIDPFDSTGANTRRPDLVWMLWSSTRTGPSDIYFQTIAPVLWPILK
ncbi:MAG: hypothetical protein ACYC96_07800 [Fimbriimonadaceae bacterium]